MASRFGSTGGSGSLSWYFQRISGALLVALVLLHYILMHYHAPGDPLRGHSFRAVYEALTGPNAAWWKTLDISLLILALWHGANGVWNVVRDFKLSAAWNMIVLGSLACAAVLFGTMGLATILSF